MSKNQPRPLTVRVPDARNAEYQIKLKKLARDRGISVNALIVGLMEAEFQKALLEESSSAQKIAP